MSRSAKVERKSNETSIAVSVDIDTPGESKIVTTVPFLDHLLSSCAFHGGFTMTIAASGDTDVDPHHLVEDTGIVIGSCLNKILEEGGAVRRFGHAVVPMDEALSQATIDVCGRPTLAYRAEYPQTHAGSFALWLLKEFFAGLTMGAKLTLHAECRYGENSHHMAEALFKALGKALGQAYQSVGGDVGDRMSTKGRI